jgi:hypothetical protein
VTLAHQDLAQLPRELREAISANARSKIFFSASPEDARDLEHHMSPNLSRHDLAHLGAFQAAARLIAGAEGAPAFTLRTEPLTAPIPGRAELIRCASRDTHSRGNAAGRGTPSMPEDDPRSRP